ncbi:hypothetical protein Tco_1164286 [Tanacetum coccineum]
MRAKVGCCDLFVVDADREVLVPETFHEQTDDELTEAEIKQMEADDQANSELFLKIASTGYEDGSRTRHMRMVGANGGNLVFRQYAGQMLGINRLSFFCTFSLYHHPVDFFFGVPSLFTSDLGKPPPFLIHSFDMPFIFSRPVEMKCSLGTFLRAANCIMKEALAHFFYCKLLSFLLLRFAARILSALILAFISSKS